MAYEYDIFLSFRGNNNTVKGFIEKLNSGLVQSGFRTFKDYSEIERGEDINLELGKAIRGSRISIIVFSKDYVSSRWCLDELVKIHQQQKNVILPVFYDMYKSEIRQQMEQIVKTFVKKKKTTGLNAALAKVLNLQGMEFGNQADGDETKFIDKIVEVVKDKRKAFGISFFPMSSGTKDWRSSIYQEQGSSGSNKTPQVEQQNVAETKDWRSSIYHKQGSSGSNETPQVDKPIGIVRRGLSLLIPDLAKIPSSLFENMDVFQVLDLSNTNIKSLPPSISSLVKLRELLLRGCELLMVLPPEIGKLTNLEVFDLEGTELICLPKEIGELSNLKCLRVSFYRYADHYRESMGKTIIPRKILSALSLLCELSIDVDPECVWWDAEVKAIIKEISRLESLKRLKLYFPTVELLQQYLQPQWHGKRKWDTDQSSSPIDPCLSHFRWTVGHHKQCLISRVPRDLQDKFGKLDRCLKYINGERNTDEIAKVLKHTNALFLDRHWTIEKLSVFKSVEMDNLKFCLLVQCNEMTNIVDGSDFYYGDYRFPTFPCLEYLSIHYMKNLESIWKGPIISGCLSNLKILSLHACPKLNTIFNLDLLGNLVNLKELIVEDCRKIESLVNVESSDLEFDQEFLPSLEKISLLHLPELVNISSGLRIARRLERMFIYNCPKLKCVSPMELSSKNMMEIKAESAWWEELEWHTSEWGSGQPDYLVRVFVPLGRDGDLMDQLVEAVKTSLVCEDNWHFEMKNKEVDACSDDFTALRLGLPFTSSFTENRMSSASMVKKFKGDIIFDENIKTSQTNQRMSSSPLGTESSFVEDRNSKVGRYTAKERGERRGRIRMYTAKRNQRNFNKTIKDDDEDKSYVTTEHQL